MAIVPTTMLLLRPISHNDIIHLADWPSVCISCQWKSGCTALYWLYHYTVYWLYHYTVYRLYHYTVYWLYHYTVYWPYHYTVYWLYHYTVYWLYHYTVYWLYHRKLSNSKKGNCTLVQAVRPIGGVEVWLYSFLTTALEGVRGQRHTPASLTPGKTWYPLYRKLGGPRAGLDRCGKYRLHRDSIPGTSSP